ncbi:hypothetical protein ABUE34_06515 [Kozakia baliensis]|uniref:hypothetical protein n=1 Tax=Kozakia baliensis TaxID=153496 RepID=UPI00345BD47A
MTFAALSLIGLFPLTAWAQEDSGGSDIAGKELNKVLGVLQVQPDSASDACVEALKELHKTQKIVSDGESAGKNQDLDVARDVLESNYEDASQICGTDARTLCRTKINESPKLPALCTTLHAHPEE